MRIFLSLCLLFSFWGELFPQVKIHRNLRVEDGLLQSTIRSICEDSDGYLWFGTESGVSRWDGLNFYNFQEHEGLSFSGISFLEPMSDGSVIIGAYYGVDKFSRGEIKNIYSIENNKFILDLEKVGSTVWAATARGIFELNNDSFVKLTLSPQIDTTAVSCIHDDKQGTIYIALRNNKILTYSMGKIEEYKYNSALPSKWIHKIYRSKDNGLFIATNRGLMNEKDGNIKYFDQSKGLSSNNISNLVEGGDGIIYIGTSGGGLNILLGSRIEQILPVNGLQDKFITALYKGSDGTIYIGTSGSGVYLHKNKQFVTYNEDVGLHDNFIMAITQDNKGAMYFGSMSEGLSVLRNNKFEIIKHESYPRENSVLFMNRTPDGNIMIVNSFTVDYYNPATNQMTSKVRYEYDVPYQIRSACLNYNGSLLVGTVGGLFKQDGKSISEISLGDKYPIMCLFSASDSSVYAGTIDDGIAIYKNGECRFINQENGLINNRIITLYENSAGDIYVGTITGLSIIKKDSIINLTREDGLSDNTIYGIIEDNFGRMYLTTNRGINVLENENGERNIRVIRAVDGLASDELNGQACWKDFEGKLWFGTVKGVTCYDPSKDTPHDNPPKIHITRARVINDDINLSEKGERMFDYDENYFRFDFIGINISSPNSVVYRYRMKGLDDNWFETKQNSVQYTNLNDADYTFEVMAKNQWGYWSKPASFSFAVTPPFWETWIFITSLTLLVLFIIIYITTYHYRQLLALERLRIKIAADLHDNIGSSLTEISILGEVLSKKTGSENESLNKGLTKITETSRELIDRMSDIVWLVNPKRDSLYDLIIRLKDSYSESFSYHGISFKSQNLQSLQNVSLNMENRQNLYLIFKEGINNSIKHSSCSEINIEAAVKGKSLEVILRDNGIGFSNNITLGNGIENMKERAKTIGGKLIVKSGEGEGTKIQFMGDIN